MSASFDIRRVAVALSGFCAFLNLYSPQALLPELSRQFGASPAEVGGIMFASTFAVAMTAPLTGAVADALGRKRVITSALFAICVPMLLVATASEVREIAAWRFVQGLLLPPIFAVTVAYIGDEWPPAQVTGVAGIYVAGSSVGGFAGRLIPGLLGDLYGWRVGLAAPAVITLVAAVAVAVMLPRETRFVRSDGLGAALRQMVRHLGNAQLLATFAVGFGTLFNFIATFTYVSFRLAAPPYHFSSTLLGMIFITYLAGALAAPWAGQLVARFGRRNFMLGVLAIWMFGALLTLSAPIALIALGLVLCAACGIVCQTVSTGYVTSIATEGRSSAVGLYVTFFYVGGSVGAVLPGLAWEHAGWPATVAMLVASLALMAAVVALVWPHARHQRAE
jgi:MFS transporter, YNFM family, putative membrane transport protein